MSEPVRDPASPYLAADDEARALARRLARTARHAALAFLEPGTGAPMTSRVALAADSDGSPILLLSQLSAHTRALAADPRLSILVGEPGDGDPLSGPRLSISGAVFGPVARDAPEREHLLRRFAAHHPAAAHYADFGDFAFFRVAVRSAFLNGGFARAYPLLADDLVNTADAEIEAVEPRVVAHMNDDHANVLDRLMERRGETVPGWRIATLDRRGFELVRGTRVERIEFDEPVAAASGFREAFVALARSLEP